MSTLTYNDKCPSCKDEHMKKSSDQIDGDVKKAIKIHESITSERVMEAIESDNYVGFCLSCGEEYEGIEPDAYKYKCDACLQLAVCGAEEILFLL
jgi:hypothetical protein